MGVKADRAGSLPPRAQLRKDLADAKDTTTLNNFLDAVDRNSKNRQNDLRVLLQICAELGNTHFVQLLLARKADVDASTNTTLPSLLYALRGDHVETVQLLFAHQARVDVIDSSGKDALMYAVLYSSAKVLELVYQQGAELERRDKQGRTALLHAAAWGRTEAIRWLLNMRADIAAADKKGMTAVMHAASGGHRDALGVLLGQRGPLEATDDYGRTAVIYAASNNHPDALQLLLDYGAEAEIEDNEGKDALLHAIVQHRHPDPKEQVISFLLQARGGIKNNAESFRYLRAAAITGQNMALKLLLDHHANVNSKDGEGRTPMQCLLEEGAKTVKYSKETISTLLNAKADIGVEKIRARITQRTIFHDAAAKGHSIIIEAVLEYLSGCLSHDELLEYVDRRSPRGKTALHLAAQNGHESVVVVLLQYGARLDAASEGNWTPLLNAAKMGHYKVVETILAAASLKDVNARTSSGMTSLHWAAEKGHKKVVELLLQDDRTWKNPKDTFNTTPLLRAGLHDHAEVFSLFRPHLLSGRISRHAQTACSLFTASVVDIYKKRHESRVVNKPMSVRKILYDVDVKDSTKFTVTTRLKDIQEGRPDFRWIHLPANNLAWADTLMTKMLIENGPIDIPAYQFMLQLFGQQQHRGSKIHSRYMRPLCQIHPNKHIGHPRLLRRPTVSVTDSSILDARSSAMTFVDLQNSPKPSLLTHSDTEEQSSDTPKEVGVLFMPYLHWETDSNRQLVRDTVQKVLSTEEQPLTRERSKDESLIHGYLHHSTDLHLRRTLDQFKHHSINTDIRDRDQVVYRHHLHQQTKKSVPPDPRIFMIDQMWLWIFDGIVITCFPERLDQPVQDPVNLFDGIISDISSKTHPPIRSVHDLAAAITNRCIGAFDRHQWGDEDLDFMFFEIFELSIGTLTRRATALLKRFEADATNVARWLSNRKYQAPETRVSFEDRDNEEDEWLNDPAEDTTTTPRKPKHNPVYVDRLLNITKETQLLIECKDIEDELGILTHVLEQQREVLQQMGEVFSGLRKKAGHQKRLVGQHLIDIERMQKQANLVNRSLTQVLDLKQKHANAIEARFARDQAEDTARQGQTIMVFTIVTIVFLPLSFVAAFFAINITEFPHDSKNGGSGIPLDWVAKYIFGVGFGFSLPLILVAFVFGDVRGWSWRLKNWFRGRKQEHHAVQAPRVPLVVTNRPDNASEEKLTVDTIPDNFSMRKRPLYRQPTDVSRATFESRTTGGDSMV